MTTLFLLDSLNAQQASEWRAGFDWRAGAAKVDITPDEPVRLSGYVVRTTPMVGIDDPLSVRALAMQPKDGIWVVMVSIDTIGLPAELTDRIADGLKKNHGLERRQFVLCATHSHTTPHLTGVVVNLFDQPLSDQEQAATQRYSDRLVKATIDSVAQAIKKASPCKIEMSQGEATFAHNRRKPTTENGTTGPVDPTVRVLRVLDEKGDAKAIAYQYACQASTIAADINRVSGDWPGISASLLEKSLPGCVALPIIGCGADATPLVRGTHALATQHGTEMAESVRKAIAGNRIALPSLDKASFSYVALSFERPKREQLDSMLESKVSQERSFARSMLDLWKRKGRIPETYPAPIHLWRFGKELTWVFIGGEVVVDYQLRLAKELTDSKKVWVAGYTDDLFAYVASERIRNEGGYEADRSMIFYNRPGRWESGTEDFLVGRIRDLNKNERELDLPLDPKKSSASISVAAGFDLELIAHEPIVQDPINVAFDSKGRVWVVEMGDYPKGGATRGRIKILEDLDHDGRYETAKIFLDGIDFPTGVYPWRDGAIVAAAPDVFWARDTNGDDVADERKVLVTGFALANPQHRVHGFTYGLDHRLHFGSGDGTRQVQTPSDNQTWTISGSDLSLDVDQGKLALQTGKTQFIRGRDDWGNWFGNDNIHPMYHYVVDPMLPKSNRPLVGSPQQHLLRPATAPPVSPLSRNADRFNDVHTANRYTSSCSSIVSRNASMGRDMMGAGLICEPVHNLVSRIRIIPNGASFRGARFPEEESSEWVRSTDTWFRPVRVENAPDGSVWIVDMYRRVIEHPEWIPDDWQERVNIRSGEGLGRLYRIVAKPDESNSPLQGPIDWNDQTTSTWLKRLTSPNGAMRDLAQRELIFRAEPEMKESLIEIAKSHEAPLGRLHAYAVLRALGWMEPSNYAMAIEDADTQVAKMGLRWAMEANQVDPDRLLQVAESPRILDAPQLAFECLCCLVAQGGEGSSRAIATLLRNHGSDEWFRRVAAMVEESRMDIVLQELLATSKIDSTMATLLPSASDKYRRELLDSLGQVGDARPEWHYLLATGLKQSANGSLKDDAYAALLRDGRKLFQDPVNADESRLAALQMLVAQSSPESSDDLPLFQEVISRTPSFNLKRVALEGVRKIGKPESADALISSWRDLSPQLRSTLGGHLVEVKTWLPRLLEALEKGKLALADLDPRTIELAGLSPDLKLRNRFEKLLVAEKGTSRLEISEYISTMPADGDTAIGSQLFQRHCVLCHLEQKEQRSIGPSLDGFKDWTDTMWLTAILDPSRAVEARYRRLSLLTEEGEVIVGVMRGETDSDLTVATVEGKSLTFKKSKLERVEETDRSLMPEGFSRFLPPDQMRHLLQFLRNRPQSLEKTLQ